MNGVKIQWRNGKPPKIWNKQTALFAAEEARKLMEPFIPYATGKLANDVTVTADDTSAQIRYNSPYAAEVYNNEREADFNTENHPLASAMWDRAMVKSGGGEKLAKSTAENMKKVKQNQK